MFPALTSVSGAEIVFRMVQLCFIMLPVAATLPVVWLLHKASATMAATVTGSPTPTPAVSSSSPPATEKKSFARSVYLEWWLSDVVLPILQFAGPSWIKLGQWAATRPDLYVCFCCWWWRCCCC